MISDLRFGFPRAFDCLHAISHLVASIALRRDPEMIVRGIAGLKASVL